jgi:hypothetical protein
MMNLIRSMVVVLSLIVSLNIAGCGLSGGEPGSGDDEETYDSYPHFIGSCMQENRDGERINCDEYWRATTDGIEGDRDGFERLCTEELDGNWRSEEKCPTSGTYFGTCVEDPEADDRIKADKFYYSEGYDGDQSTLRETCEDGERAHWEER